MKRARKMKYDVLSPDNISIEGGGGHPSLAVARGAIKEWATFLGGCAA